MIRLKSKIKFSINVQPICIFTEYEKLKNNIACVASWGAVDNYENLAIEAQIVNLTIVDLVRCFIIESELATIHWEESFCAESNMSGVCRGDSGSGLYVEINGKYFLKGIVSSSIVRDCSQKAIALYSDVTKYFQFIKVLRNSYIIPCYFFNIYTLTKNFSGEFSDSQSDVHL